MWIGLDKLLLICCLVHGLPCDESTARRDKSGTIQYDGQYYPVKDYCIFITSFDNSVITVSFTSFKVGDEDQYGNCSDFVEISSSKDELSTRYCGNSLPPTYHSVGGEVWLRVHREIMADDSFSLHYSFVPSCNGDVEIASYTFITSPRYPKRETSYTHCTRKISAQNSQIQIQVTDKEFYYGVVELKIYDGQDINAPLLVSFNTSTWADEKNINTIYTTSGHHAVIVYTNEEKASSRFNATVKIKGYCIPGTYSCGDGENCFDHDQKCDSNRDCSNGYDELACHGCPPSRFWCGMLDKNCYAQEQFCDGMKDCEANGEDERYCESCKPGSFLCKSQNRCIYERWRCDGDFDCDDGSDEKDCDHKASRRVITAAIIGSLVCSLLLVIALGCTCKLYSLRASHHRYPLYRATPLTRVEREIFQRQAPPTYDMTVSGSSNETSSNISSRHQRRRRNRSRRRYQFQRSMPSSLENSQENSRTEMDTNSPSNEISAPLIVSYPNNTQATVDDVRDSVTTLVMERVPDIIADMILGSHPQMPDMGQGNDVTSSQVEKRDSGTQTNPSSPHSSNSITPHGSTSVPAPNVPAGNRDSSNASLPGRSERISSRSRSRRRGGSSSSSNTNSKEKQAKPLPAKRKIKPVFVSAPCPDSLVEDTLTCVYPCPPSYSQAISNTPEVCEGNSVQGNAEPTEKSSPKHQTTLPEASPSEIQDSVFASQTPDVKPKINFPFSLGQVIKNIATSPFSKFQKNPYAQMESLDNNVNGLATNLEALGPTRHNRSSASSTDESLIDVAPNEDFAAFNLEQNTTMADSNKIASDSTMTKEFPPRKNNRKVNSRPDQKFEDVNAVELSDFDERGQN